MYLLDLKILILEALDYRCRNILASVIERFIYLDLGMDIKHTSGAIAALTLGKDMSFRGSRQFTLFSISVIRSSITFMKIL
jgi:hypothetical protein